MKHKFYAKSVKIAQSSNRIEEVANRVGIVLPSSHTALFQSVYSPIEESNDNGVRLAKEAVEESLPKIIGAQANLEHLGRNWIIGMILDAWVNANNEIEIVYSFAKNIYVEEYAKALEKMQDGELAVSFELLTTHAGQERMSDGTILLHDIDFQGVGVLIDETPAYKKAITYEVASNYKDRVIKHQKELVFAKEILKNCDEVLAEEQPVDEVDELMWTTITERVGLHIHVLKIDMEGNGESIGTFGDDEKPHVHKIVNYQVQEADGHSHRMLEELLAKRKEEVKNIKQAKDKNTETKQGGTPKMTEEEMKLIASLREELGDFAKEVSDKELLEEAKVEEIRKAKSESDKEDQPSDLELAQSKVTELEAENAELKATIEAKNSEIDSVRENAEKIGKLKVELKDNSYVAEFKDEDYLDEALVERAKMKKENDDLKAKNEELAKKNVEVKEQLKASKGPDGSTEDLPTGHNDDNEAEETPRQLIARLNKK